MIKNEHQLEVSKSWVEKFQQAIVTMHANEEKRLNDPEGWQLLIDSYYAHIKNIQSEIEEYESLKQHNPLEPLVLQNINLNVDDIGEILVKARIAKKITEQELAVLAQLSEEQIKEYEKKDYQNASFDTVIEVANCLGIRLQHCIVVSEINEFLSNELMKVRQSSSLDNQVKAAS